jgi:hypothetical protein
MTGIVITDEMVLSGMKALRRAESSHSDANLPNEPFGRYSSFTEYAVHLVLQAALTNQPESGEAVVDDKAAIDYALRYGGMCRDCADTRVRGICDNSGMPCDSEVCRKVITHALGAWRYGLKHGYLAASPVTEQAEVERLRKALQRQADNMAFILNHAELGRWYDKFTRELSEDRAALSKDVNR